MNTTDSPTKSLTHVVVGAGPIGSGTALRLADAGHDVTVVTRSGGGPRHTRVTLVAADASDEARLTALATGAHTIFNCANPPYHRWASDWPPLAASLLGTAELTGARLVITGNLYMYAAGSSPMRSTDPLDPPSKKGAIRARMWEEALAAHDAGKVRVTEVRASDFFGPGLGQNGHFADRAIPQLVAGKKARFLGETDIEHSWTYVDDVCSMLALVSGRDDAFGRGWHVPTLPPMTVRGMADAISRRAGHDSARVGTLQRSLMRAAGLVSPLIRELDEVRYQHEAPFVIDDSDARAAFGIAPTPLDEQIDATLEAYRSA